MDTQAFLQKIYGQLESIGADATDVALTGRGAWRRLNSVSGRRNNGHISYWLDQDGLGVFGYAVNHHSGENRALLAQRDWRQFKGEAREAVKRQIREAKKAREAELRELREQAAIHAKAVDASCAAVEGLLSFSDMGLMDYVARGAYVRERLGVAGEYVAQKGIIPYGAKIWNGGRIDGVEYKPCIFLPRYFDGGVVSYQRIFSHGDNCYKLYQENGQAEGALYVVGRRAPDKPTVICEGWATACSIHEATGWYVIVAFDCNNLLRVTEVYRGKNEKADIIVAADSDQWRFKHNRVPDVVDEDGVVHKVKGGDLSGDAVEWQKWRQEGRLHNIGLEKATEVAKLFSARVCEPGFTDRDIAKKSDFNDLHLAAGVEAVRERLEGAEAIEQKKDLATYSVGSIGIAEGFKAASVFTPRDDWKAHLTLNEEGEIAKSNVNNQVMAITSCVQLRGAFKYDEFFDKIVVFRDIESVIPDDEFKPIYYDSETDPLKVQTILQGYGMTPPNKSVIEERILGVAKRNKCNLLRDRFDSLEWDGVSRIDSWLVRALGAKVGGDDGSDERYLAAIGRCWLMSGAARVYKPGCKFDHVLMIDGLQGGGKSTAFQILGAILDDAVDRDIYGESSIWGLTTEMNIENITSKDGMLQTRGNLIVLMDEIVGFAKKTDEELKNWIQARFDDMRVPYGRDIKRYMRRFIIAGTTNKQEYLRDDENRRYWTFTSSGKMDMEWLRDNRFQLWAEAVHRYKQGERRYLTDEEYEMQKAESKKRKETDILEYDVMKAVDNINNLAFNTGEVVSMMNLPIQSRDKRVSDRVCSILKANGYESKTRRIDGKNAKVWIKKDSDDMDDF
jgi:predicted P-loop ATPase/phage/plasmid primase-like uncharacterized protein